MKKNFKAKAQINLQMFQQALIELLMTSKRRTKNEERRTGGLRAAFTLIEVLVAMTILSIMVLMVANIFQSSSMAWNIGTQKADMNTAARAALDFMARELAGAVAGPVEAGSLATNISFQVINGDELRFASLVGDVANGRALRNGTFYILGNQLMYAHQTNNPYNNLPSSAGAGMLITNVLGLQVSAFANESALNSGVGVVSYASNSLPLCLDIAVEMLSNDDMQRYAKAGTDFRARNAKLYSTRIYFPNRKGYGAR